MRETNFLRRLPTFFPHILTIIIDSLPEDCLPSFRRVSKAFHAQVDKRLQRHIVIAEHGSLSALCPVWSADWDMRSVRTIDWYGPHDPEEYETRHGCFGQEVFKNCETLLQNFPNLRNLRIVDDRRRGPIDATCWHGRDPKVWPSSDVPLGGVQSPKLVILQVRHFNRGDIVWLEICSATGNDAAYVLLDVQVPPDVLDAPQLIKQEWMNVCWQLRHMGRGLPPRDLLMFVGLEAWGNLSSGELSLERMLSQNRTSGMVETVEKEHKLHRTFKGKPTPESELEPTRFVRMADFRQMVSEETMELAAELYHNLSCPADYESLREGDCAFGCVRH